MLRHAVKEHLKGCVQDKPSTKKSTNGTDKEKSNGNGGKQTPNGEIAVMPPKSKKRKLDDSMSHTFSCAHCLVESVNEKTTPPKKKSTKVDKDEPEPSVKKEKKKKPKPTVAKPKRTILRPR